MKEDARTAVKHEFEHARPTVIHNPEQDMTILARWVHRGIEQGPKFWYMLGGVVVAIIVGSLLINNLSRGRSSIGRAWTELGTATTPQQVLEIADAYPNTEVGRAARLQAGAAYFREGTNDLTRNRDESLTKLTQALKEFQEVAKTAPHDSPEALAAAFAAARTLEARNELPDAIEQYKAVASGWPGTPEAKHSEELAAKLADPEVIDFYKQLYAYKPPTASMPTNIPGLPSIPGLSNFPGLPDNHPPLGGPTIPTTPFPGMDALKDLLPPSGLGPMDLPPPPGATTPEPPASKPAEPKPAADTKKLELPKDVFAPPSKPKS